MNTSSNRDLPDDKKGFSVDYSKSRLLGFMFWDKDGNKSFVKNKTEFMNPNRDFQITDEMVIEFLNSSSSPLRAVDMVYQWEQFKSLKSSEPSLGWEILSVFKDDNWTCDKDIFDFRLKSGWQISQVKRLFDGLTLQENDVCIVSFDDGKGFQGTINHFTYCNGIIDVYFKEQMSQCFRLDGLNIQKPEKAAPKPLFKDFLGNDVFEGDKYWFVSIDFTISSNDARKTANSGDSPDRYKYFRNKSDCHNYVLMNKPCLSVNDVESMYGDGRSFVGTGWLIDKLIELAKSKINSK